MRLDPLEELREIEINARRLSGRRNVLVAPGESSPTPWLLRTGWGRDRLDTGELADFVEIDLDHPTLDGVAPEDLGSALVFGAGGEVISAAWVNGRRVYEREAKGV
ncbi:hypothetical protein BH24ACT22_BH24ACT22_03750 [soil metagenome]